MDEEEEKVDKEEEEKVDKEEETFYSNCQKKYMNTIQGCKKFVIQT